MPEDKKETKEKTDRQTLVDMFERAGVVWEPSNTAEGAPIEVGTDGEHNEGYPGFVAQFEFDENGNLKTVGVWE